MIDETKGAWGALKYLGDWKLSSDGTIAHLQWCDETGTHDALLPMWLIDRLIELKGTGGGGLVKAP